jgi:hypothetical protein
MDAALHAAPIPRSQGCGALTWECRMVGLGNQQNFAAQSLSRMTPWTRQWREIAQGPHRAA